MIVRYFQRYFPAAIALLCMAITLPDVLRAQPFEGEITMQMASPMMGAKKIVILYSIKGDNILQSGDDPQAGKISIYNNLKTGTQIIVQEAQKQGMEIDQSTVDSVMKSMKATNLVPKPTGQKEKFSGYDCDIFSMMIDSTQEMDMWMTKDLPKDVNQGVRKCTETGMKTTGMKSDALLALLDQGYAQVRMEVKMKGVTQLTNEFVKAESKKLKDSIFVVPSDIKVTKFDPSTMGGGAGGQ